jgi:hypothetical protein
MVEGGDMLKSEQEQDDRPTWRDHTDTEPMPPPWLERECIPPPAPSQAPSEMSK